MLVAAGSPMKFPAYFVINRRGNSHINEKVLKITGRWIDLALLASNTDPWRPPTESESECHLNEAKV